MDFFSACVDTLTFQAFFFLLPSPVVTFRDRGRGSGIINSAFFPLVLLRCASGFSFLLSLNEAPNQLDGVMLTLCMFNLSTVSGYCCVYNGYDRCAFSPLLANAAHGRIAAEKPSTPQKKHSNHKEMLVHLHNTIKYIIDNIFYFSFYHVLHIISHYSKNWIMLIKIIRKTVH